MFYRAERQRLVFGIGVSAYPEFEGHSDVFVRVEVPWGGVRERPIVPL